MDRLEALLADAWTTAAHELGDIYYPKGTSRRRGEFLRDQAMLFTFFLPALKRIFMAEVIGENEPAHYLEIYEPAAIRNEFRKLQRKILFADKPLKLAVKGESQSAKIPVLHTAHTMYETINQEDK